MTEETQALVDRLRAIHRRGIELFGEGMLADDLRNAQSASDRVCERWVEEARGDARIGLDVLAIRDAAAALTALARDLETARQERDEARGEAERYVTMLCNERAANIAAVRAARAETWAEAGSELRKQADASTNDIIKRTLGMASMFCIGMGNAAREGQ